MSFKSKNVSWDFLSFYKCYLKIFYLKLYTINEKNQSILIIKVSIFWVSIWSKSIYKAKEIISEFKFNQFSLTVTKLFW